MQYATGDLVRLKSGGPLLTVVQTENDPYDDDVPPIPDGHVAAVGFVYAGRDCETHGDEGEIWEGPVRLTLPTAALVPGEPAAGRWVK